MREYILHLETLIKVSELNSFTQTADMLGLSKPAVSKRIKALEKYLGRPVVNRSNRNVTLTPFGERLVEKSIEALQYMDNFDSWAKHTSDELLGTVQIVSFEESVFQETLAQLIPEFKEKYPGISLTFKEVAPPKEYDRIEADIIWGAGEYIGRRAKGLRSKPIMSSTFGIFCSPQYLKSKGEIKSIKDLKKCEMVSYTHRIPHDHLFYSSKGRSGDIGSEKMTVSVETNRGYVQLAADGMGLINCSLESKVIQDHLKAGTLVPVLEDYWIKDMTIYAFYDTSNFTSPHVRAFIDFFTSRLEER